MRAESSTEEGWLLMSCAILIPYRNREEHLKRFLEWIPNKIVDQNGFLINYKIYVIEQGNDKMFNRGKLLNIGATLTHSHSEYFCFHDVDMLPIKADYSFPLCPTHLAAYASQFKDKKISGLAYPEYFGGVTLINKDDFYKIDGFSNNYWGYGAEDDDLLYRIKKHDLTWIRREGVFESLPHPYNGESMAHEINLMRLKDIKEGNEIDNSGLKDLTFKLIRKEEFPHYTLYSVDI